MAKKEKLAQLNEKIKKVKEQKASVLAKLENLAKRKMDRKAKKAKREPLQREWQRLWDELKGLYEERKELVARKGEGREEEKESFIKYITPRKEVEGFKDALTKLPYKKLRNLRVAGAIILPGKEDKIEYDNRKIFVKTKKRSKDEVSKALTKLLDRIEVGPAPPKPGWTSTGMVFKEK